MTTIFSVQIFRYTLLYQISTAMIYAAGPDKNRYVLLTEFESTVCFTNDSIRSCAFKRALNSEC